MKTSCFVLILCLILISAAGVMAKPVTPGAFIITGQMYLTGDPLYDYDLDQYIPVRGWYAMEYNTLYAPGDLAYLDLEEGDPQDLMFYQDFQIGIRDGVYAIPIGTYEEVYSLAFLGHFVWAIDFTVSPTTIDTWPQSQCLRLEFRSSSDTIYWWTDAPISYNDPMHVQMEFDLPINGYGFRLTVVPEASSLAAVLSGLGLLAYIRRRRG